MKLVNKFAVAALFSMLVAQTPASAQSYYARHKLEVVSGPQGPAAAWETGTWGPWSTTCSDAAVRTRTVLCKKGEELGVDTNCPMFDRPPTSDVQSVLTSCSYRWDPRPGTWSQSCGAGSTRTTTNVCVRSDNTVSADNLCSGTKPAPITETRTSYDGCKSKDWALTDPKVIGACIAGQERTQSTFICIINGVPSADTACHSVPKPSAFGSNACGPVTNNCVSLGKQQAMNSPNRVLIGTQTTVTGGLDRDSIAINMCNKFPTPIKNCSSEVTMVGGQYQVTAYGLPLNAPNVVMEYSNGYNMGLRCTQ